MHIVFDPAEDRPHEDWLRSQAGAYEWWYFDAISDDGLWSLVAIWFLGNPFSSYTRQAARRCPADPFTHNAVFFALSRGSHLFAYHFTQFPPAELDEKGPLQFGSHRLDLAPGEYRLQLDDVNGNGRRLMADLTFSGPPVSFQEASEGAGDHWWLPALPTGRVKGRIAVLGPQDVRRTEISFSGRGYHDHNWGRLPFSDGWAWARADLGAGRSAILYHYPTIAERGSRLLLFQDGRLTHFNAEVQIREARWRGNAFGLVHPTQFDVRSGPHEVRFRLTTRLDSAPFYLRTRCEATVDSQSGVGFGEIFRPQGMGTALMASAMRSRIVER